MPAFVNIVVKVVSFVVQVVFWFFVVKSLDKGLNTMRDWRLRRLAAKAAA